MAQIECTFEGLHFYRVIGSQSTELRALGDTLALTVVDMNHLE